MLLSLVIAAALLAAVSGQVDLIPSEFDLPLWAIPAYLGMLLFYFGARAARWHILLRPLGATSLRVTTLVGIAGFMWIALLPMRLGELSRPLFLAQKTEVSLSRALGSIALERVVDGLFICGLFFALVAPRGDDAALAGEQFVLLLRVGTVASAGFLVALLLLLGMAFWPHAFGRAVAKPIRVVSPGLADRLEGVASGVAEGLAALPSPRPLLGFLLATATYWTITALSMWVLARGVGLDLGPIQMLAIMSVHGIAVLIPGGPAQLGPFQGGILVGLALFVSPTVLENEGSAYIFYLYVCQMVTIVIFGLLAQRSLGLDWRAMLPRRQDETSDQASDQTGPST